MSEALVRLASRRAFLRFLAWSPAVYAASQALGCSLPDSEEPSVISRVNDAINVFDFQEVAERKLMPGHYTYLSMGVDDGRTVRANRDGFAKLQLRMRRLVDVRAIDTSIELFGEHYETPVVLAPCASQKMFHPEAELAVARAAREKGLLQILSTISTRSVEEVNAVRGAPVWFQLYATHEWQVTQALVKRAEAAGCTVLVLTVDLLASNREALARYRRDSNPECLECHTPGLSNLLVRRPMFDGIDVSKLRSIGAPQMTWEFVDRLRNSTSMKLLLKGIVTREDAALAVEHGVEGLIVSNHGGRSEESGRATIDSLPEVVAAVAGRIPVLVDSGFRRGTDIFKALALGADAIAIGRPYLWGLASFGQEGVEAVLDILQRELQIVMKQAGTTSTEAITRSALVL
jgi:isopentenyl diphosphate isomerase/L-lactate dehydrogenase-like FMN-dependent dehydrogenase